MVTLILGSLFVTLVSPISPLLGLNVYKDTGNSYSQGVTVSYSRIFLLGGVRHWKSRPCLSEANCEFMLPTAGPQGSWWRGAHSWALVRVSDHCLVCPCLIFPEFKRFGICDFDDSGRSPPPRVSHLTLQPSLRRNSKPLAPGASPSNANYSVQSP